MFKDRYEKVKLHVKEHKKEYLIGAGGVVIGAAGMYIFRKPEALQVIKNTALVVYKPVQTNNTIAIAARGHRGNVIWCNELQRAFASQSNAAKELGLHASNLSSHLAGRIPHVGGYTFRNFGENLSEKLTIAA